MDLGYNSLGTFCGGWAGHCGEGGVMGITWYLLCQKCREKYLREKRQLTLNDKPKKVLNKKKHSQITTYSFHLEAHQIMRNNAMFLLQFSSSSNGSLKNIQPFSTPLSRRNSYSGRNGHQPMTEINTYHNPFPNVVFQCLQTLGVSESDLSLMSDTFFQDGNESSLNIQNGVVHEYIPSLSVATDEKVNSPSSRYSEARKSTGSDFRGSRSFHRSISIGINPCDWQKLHDSVIVGEDEDITRNKSDGVVRRRNNSSSGTDESGLSLLCHPSAALTKLVHLVADKRVNAAEIALNRPVMKFILQKHDLNVLHLAIRQAIRKSACRIYAMQALNWLLKSVTQPTSLHNLLWCFMDAMIIQHNDLSFGRNMDYLNKKNCDPEPGVCEHPLSDITICGDAAHPLPSVFHNLLQTISDLMMLLPLGSSLQQIAMCCWCIKFRPSDHAFLHRSHVFSNISRILSRSEDLDEMNVSFTDSMQVTSIVEQQINLTPNVEIKTSSRQGMILNLTDQCTDTFWESGDEDRNKQKYVILTCGSQLHQPHGIYVHIDNTRDVGQKISHVCFKSGLSSDDLVKLLELDIEAKYCGWIFCPILEPGHCVIKLELKGPDNAIRLRQVKVLGAIEGESLSIGKPVPSSLLQQRNCESETLKVFRVLTSQVFGKLVSNNYDSDNDEKIVIAEDPVSDMLCNPESSNDLKEHMVGILFSQSKLTDLQKQVCTHIVQAIRKETSRVKDEWESTLHCSKQSVSEDLLKSSDIYCFEMLSMVLALSGSSVGRQYLAQQYTLLKDLLTLLHTGSARVQRQVTLLLRRVLPEVMPATLANILGVPSLPPTDYSIVAEANSKSSSSSSPLHSIEHSQSNFDMHRMGILDVFLSCIAKVLTVQMKVKNSQNSKGVTVASLTTSIHPGDYVGSRWWLRGYISRKLAEDIIILLKDMAAGKLSSTWAAVTKDAIAENILALTKLDASCRNPSECIKTPILWLSLASLCVLNEDHVERLTSGQWLPGINDGQARQPRPTCDNHEDNETQAIIKCNVCGNLCIDCDRFLHLHSKTRTHQRQVFKEEEEAIKVDLHEGCGRIKLYWVMVLADSQTLKAMVEFREGDRGKGSVSSVGTCRFCGITGTSGLLAIGNVCGDKDCQESNKNACIKTLPCGHMCQGVRGEYPCLPCLHGCGNDQNLKQDADDMCMICFTEALACAPSIQLKCGHVFHLNCCKQVLTKKWNGPRITFGFSLCPVCKYEIDHSLLQDLLNPIRMLYEDVRRKALMRLEYEGLNKVEEIMLAKTKFHNDAAGFAMDRYAYYVCYKCKKAYYGGEARCDADAGGGYEYDPTELVCGGCSDVSRAQMCPKHGADFLEYKCRYCCSVAVFFCFGTTHFCNACHDDFQRITTIPKHELPHCPAGPKARQVEGEECPLHVKHPATGEEFALGCGVCRNAHTF
ncbi:E3 ubiquitin-protein ligase MYCBP2 [Nymphon striatum]|nr:E3 ubiquitin-protein ligase MYCBP2 [Nymphon striatum]